MALNGVQLKGRDVAAYLHDAGWRDLNLVTAVAVCHAESDFYTEAENDQNPDGSIDYGIMQLNSVHLGENLGGILCSKESCFDPARCCKMAHVLYHAEGWAPWVAYADGRYKDNLAGAIISVANFQRITLGIPLPTP